MCVVLLLVLSDLCNVYRFYAAPIFALWAYDNKLDLTTNMNYGALLFEMISFSYFEKKDITSIISNEKKGG